MNYTTKVSGPCTRLPRKATERWWRRCSRTALTPMRRIEGVSGPWTWLPRRATERWRRRCSRGALTPTPADLLQFMCYRDRPPALASSAGRAPAWAALPCPFGRVA
ncbi:uncharacterized protein [Penaeus vannamei]|uniref:uncharacterized protein n=1 Tax=Penaeus vannamei TaxID=6689 RepID=UPI00387F6DD4